LQPGDRCATVRECDLAMNNFLDDLSDQSA
jgi:hypothetical protein